MEKFLNRVIAACDRYHLWYQKSKWGDYNIPSCPLCGAGRSELVMGPPRLTAFRYQNARVTMPVVCGRCSGRMLASSAYGSKNWTYFIN